MLWSAQRLKKFLVRHLSGNTIVDGGYNISDDTSCGFSSHNHSLGDYSGTLFSGGLANNGGPTQMIALDTGNSSNPAIDAIPVAYCTDQASPPNPLTTDQRGYSRPDEGESACDIGAYESGATAPGAKLDDTPTGRFELDSSITFAGPIDPVTQNLTLQIGSYSVTIPAGSFRMRGRSRSGYAYLLFERTISGVSLRMRLVPRPDGSFRLQAEGSGANPSEITNPVMVTVTMTASNGDVVATSSIVAIANQQPEREGENGNSA